jgi:hypothetical protein
VSKVILPFTNERVYMPKDVQFLKAWVDEHSDKLEQGKCGDCGHMGSNGM